MVATARAEVNGGFISSVPVTAVYLNWTTGSQSPTEILSLADQSERADEVKVGMTWVDPNHLLLTYDGKRQNIGFQAVKFAGVDIFVRDISHTTSGSNGP
jgi:hypothetical protein